MSNTNVFWLICLLFACALPDLRAQDEPELAKVRGIVRDTLGEELMGVNVLLMIDGVQATGVQTDINGAYEMVVPANKRFELVFSYVGMRTRRSQPYTLLSNEMLTLPITLDDGTQTEIIVRYEEPDRVQIKPDDLRRIALASGNLETVLQFLTTGVSAGTGGELTSQYSVRGGNYDENLIYVNGFEIYRPLLIRSSQQEGLTFPNADMLDYLTFSNGGFRAQYGDKMSSVLDVTYRRPTEKFESSVGASLLGGQLYFGGARKLDTIPTGRRFTWTTGLRYKTTQYLLTSQAVRGEYVPTFLDFQTNLIADVGKRGKLEFLGNYSFSRFKLVPRDGSNDTGLFNYVLNLTSRFEGKELSDFTTSMLGLAYSWASKDSTHRRDSSHYRVSQTRHRVQGSYFQSYENERIDILAEYWLTQKESNFGSEDFGEPVATLGYGMTHQYARNYLTINIANLTYRGVWSNNIYDDKVLSDSTLRSTESYHETSWGVDVKNERVSDDLKEWTRYDSLYYTVPFDTSAVLIPQYYRTQVDLNTMRFQGYAQHSLRYITPKSKWEVIAGVRANYWTLNDELVFSPRMQLFYTPRRFSNPIGDTTHSSKDLTFKLCVGAYHQPPFYRELRNLEGQLNYNVLAQRSFQAVGGVVWDFVAWKRRFKFISELFYKHQTNLVAYDVDNVRIRYYGDNNASGYVMGWDFRLNGEFVKGLDSWLNLSFMRARERFDGVQHGVRSFNGLTVDTTWLRDVPKPTDQLFILSMYFQDHIPKAEWAQVNVALTVGSGMAFGVPRNNIEFRNTYRYLPYHRVDIGFSFTLFDQAKYIKKHYDSQRSDFLEKEKSPLRRTLRSAWLSLEVFNLMQVANQSSYNWIRTFENVSYGIPNTLTSRRLNLRFRVEF